MDTYLDLVARKGSGTPFDDLIRVRFQLGVNPFNLNPPKDYVDFLLEIGAGKLGNYAYVIYGGLVESDEIFGEPNGGDYDVLLFGDDFQGYCAGFRLSDWKVVEIDPVSKEVYEIAPTFHSFIRNKILEISWPKSPYLPRKW
ncbi:SMI1/KNR4 family protein [Achromobacter sp.]|uniref:SMI1/KNR4 family protein n=1 Tax=Achromobacter sp. TaxID=134375 RepID=UPI0028ACC16A|nr:SMI1/KNR4 family protein [Achromobacter sp.]